MPGPFLRNVSLVFMPPFLGRRTSYQAQVVNYGLIPRGQPYVLSTPDRAVPA